MLQNVRLLLRGAICKEKSFHSIRIITLVNIPFCAKKISTILEYFDVAESENDIGFSKLTLVSEIFYIFVLKKC